MKSDRVAWIGRVTRPGEAREHTVRIWTDGEPPGPHAALEPIDDPFALARPWSGGESAHDAATLCRTLPRRDDGPGPTLADVVLGPPVRPTKIICIGRNYAAHAQEMGNAVPDEPILFHKPPSALLGSGASLRLPRGYERIDMESELVAVIGKPTRDVTPERALEHVAGYTLGNDVSCRDLQNKDKQWTRAKGFDGFAPCGPFVRIVDPGETPPGQARIQGTLDDELRQDAPLGAMIFDVAHLIAYVARVMTLEPGDLLFTGTPAGVCALAPGSVIEIGLQGWHLGRLLTSVC